jgi:hypothetical protein
MTDPSIDALFRLMSRQHGVARSSQARALGIDSRTEARLARRGILLRPAAGVLVAAGAPRTWEQRALEAVWAPGRAILSHGAAARVHRLDGFERYESIDVVCRKGWWPDPPPGTITHFTRGLHDDDIVEIDSIPSLSVAATLALLAPSTGLGRTARALDSALRLGHDPDELRAVATRWRRRGRAGPPMLILLLDEREGRALPRHDITTRRAG